MKNRIAFLVIALTLGLTPARVALAQSRTYTTIDFPGAIETGAAGINNLGQIVGAYVLPDQSRHGFLYSGGVFTTIDDPNAPTSSEALGINNSGQIVGAYNLNSPEGGHVFEGAHAFLYSAGIFTTLDYPAAGVTNTTALKINNSSNIAGVYRINLAQATASSTREVPLAPSTFPQRSAVALTIMESMTPETSLASTRPPTFRHTKVSWILSAFLPPLMSLERSTPLQ